MPPVFYMRLFVERDIKCADICLNEAVCRQRLELCLTTGYMKLCVDRKVNCGDQLVT